MSEGAIREVIERVLGDVNFEPPMSVAYCAAVRDALRGVLPAGSSVEVMYSPVQFSAHARVGERSATVVLPLA